MPLKVPLTHITPDIVKFVHFKGFLATINSKKVIVDLHFCPISMEIT